MKELVVISGKGGTGKTSIVAAFAALAEKAVLADCDVDASDLHLVLAPEVRRREEFRSGREAVIRQTYCIGCGACLAHCRFEAVLRLAAEELRAAAGGAGASCLDCDFCARSCPVRNAAAVREMHESLGDGREAVFMIDPVGCEGCGVCVHFCPVKAIDFPERLCGEWFVSDTRCGPMVHARLGIAEENSGKLVSLVRRQAREIAEARGLETILIDGSPGIGCPVIASITGAALVLAVTEPTLSGRHDLERVLKLAAHFNTPAMVLINKADLNPEMAANITGACRERGIRVAGEVPYDTSVTRAQLDAVSVIELAEGGPADQAIRAVWERVRTQLEGE